MGTWRSVIYVLFALARKVHLIWVMGTAVQDMGARAKAGLVPWITQVYSAMHITKASTHHQSVTKKRDSGWKPLIMA
jgi:hypothetical protein